MKRNMASIIFTLVSSFVCTELIAGQANVHLIGGASFTEIGSNPKLSFGEVVNQLTPSQNVTSPLFGVGLGYQFDRLFRQSFLALDLGLTGFYVHNNMKGIETPAINLNVLPNGADTFSYTMKETSWTLLVEPKVIYTSYAWKPYLLAGFGVAENKMSQFNELPTDPAGSASNPNSYANKNSTQFAYEVGVGVQHTLYRRKSSGQLILAVEYRYMNFGGVELGATSNHTIQQGPNFGSLSSNLIDANLSFQF